MNRLKRTRYGARRRCGVNAGERMPRGVRAREARARGGAGRPPPACSTLLGPAAAKLLAAVLLPVLLQQGVRPLCRLVERGLRRLLPEDGAVDRLLHLELRVTDAGHCRREVDVRELLREHGLVLERLEALALANAVPRRDLPALRPVERVLADPVDEHLRRLELVLVRARLAHDHQVVRIAPDATLASDLRQRRDGPRHVRLLEVLRLPDAVPVEAVLLVLERDVVGVL